MADKRPKMKEHPRENRIVLLGSTRKDSAAMYPRGKVYSPFGICPCILRGANTTGSGNEPHILIEYEGTIKF